MVHNKSIEPCPPMHVEHLFTIANRLLPAEMLQSPERRMRGYLLLTLLGISIFATVMVIPWMVFILELSGSDLLLGLTIDIAAVAGYLAAAAALVRYKNFSLASNLNFAFLLAINFGATQLSGGFMESPILHLTLFGPVFAFVIFGMRGGIFWLLLTTVVFGVSYLCSVFDVGQTQLIPDKSHRELMRAGFFFLLVLMGGTGLVVYEAIHEELRQELRKERDEFQYHASHDMLTGLPNRFQFFDYFERMLARARREGGQLALTYIDLDGFKPINDNYGHHAGDAILEAISARLRRSTRADDMVARFGGDEFVMLSSSIKSRAGVEAIVARLIDSIQEPIKFDGRHHVVTASAGVALFPAHADSVDGLCRDADIALYRAKERNNTFCFYDGGIDENQELAN